MNGRQAFYKTGALAPQKNPLAGKPLFETSED
jgi:hypothetical protein